MHISGFHQESFRLVYTEAAQNNNRKRREKTFNQTKQKYLMNKRSKKNTAPETARRTRRVAYGDCNTTRYVRVPRGDPSTQPLFAYLHFC